MCVCMYVRIYLINSWIDYLDLFRRHIKWQHIVVAIFDWKSKQKQLVECYFVKMLVFCQINPNWMKIHTYMPYKLIKQNFVPPTETSSHTRIYMELTPNASFWGRATNTAQYKLHYAHMLIHMPTHTHVLHAHMHTNLQQTGLCIFCTEFGNQSCIYITIDMYCCYFCGQAFQERCNCFAFRQMLSKQQLIFLALWSVQWGVLISSDTVAVKLFVELLCR